MIHRPLGRCTMCFYKSYMLLNLYILVYTVNLQNSVEYTSIYSVQCTPYRMLYNVESTL